QGSIILRQEILDVWEQDLRRLSQSQLAPGFLVEPDVQLILQNFKLFVDGRGAQMELLGGARDAADIGQRHQATKFAQFHSCFPNPEVRWRILTEGEGSFQTSAPLSFRSRPLSPSTSHRSNLSF